MRRLYLLFFLFFCYPSGTNAQTVSTIAGTWIVGYSGDGGPATIAEINCPVSLAVDAAGNVFFSDSATFVVRKINTSGIISTVAGIAGTHLYSGDGGPATSATFNLNSGMALDGAGNIYISDYGASVIRKVNTTGIINVFGGSLFSS